MTAYQVKLARQMLGLNQTDFALLLGWTTKRNVVNLEREEKPVQLQTSLAIECLLRRAEKFQEFEKLVAMQPVLAFILDKIKAVNATSENPIAQDDDNGVLLSIFADATDKFSDMELEIVDDEDALCELFGLDGYTEIRDAENGI